MAKGRSKQISADTQLNLFGDFLNSDEGEEPQEDGHNGQFRRDGQEPSKEVPAESLQQVGAGGSSGGAPGERGADGGGGAAAAGIGAGDEAERSTSDRSTEVHPDPARGGQSRAAGQLRGGHTDDRGNYRINAGDGIGEGGKVQKYEENVAAIRLLKLLDQEKRYATPEEQEVLVKYTGWGGLAEAFKEDSQGKWKERFQELRDVLSESEYRSASRSTINAHYTDPEIARCVWKAVVRLGYSGGPTLEPPQ